MQLRVLILLLLSIIFQHGSHGQNRDYAVFRDSILPVSCGSHDSELVAGTIARLQRIDTSQTRLNLHMLYGDLGFYHYLLYARYPSQHPLSESIGFNNIALYHSPTYVFALWNNLIAYSLLRDCANVSIYLEKYKTAVPRRKWEKEQLKQIDKMCSSKS